MTLKKRKGLLILEKINFEYVFKRKVTTNNKTSSKVTLPKELIGKYVYVIVDSGED